jgi:hypothetical protein
MGGASLRWRISFGVLCGARDYAAPAGAKGRLAAGWQAVWMPPRPTPEGDAAAAAELCALLHRLQQASGLTHEQWAELFLVGLCLAWLAFAESDVPAAAPAPDPQAPLCAALVLASGIAQHDWVHTAALGGGAGDR